MTRRLPGPWRRLAGAAALIAVLVAAWLAGAARPAAAVLATTALATTALATTGPAAAAAAPAGGRTPFSVAPSPLASGQPRPYFQLALSAGQSATETVIITNQATSTATLKVSASFGITAPNSGAAFTGYYRHCTGVGCWVTGLPSTVTLRHGASKALPFTVTVPAGAPPRQYLAGITVQPAVPPPAVTVGGKGEASAKEIIITQISVGVAVTVGPLPHLRTRLKISAVTAGSVGPVPRLYVHVRNTGQTFAIPAGTASCTADGRHLSFPVSSGTILPADTAVLPVNATGLRPGQPAPCTVRLRHSLAAAWHGTLTIPAIEQRPIIRTSPGAYSTLPPSPDIPAWAIALITIAAITLLAMAATAVRLLRRRRDTPAPPDITAARQDD